MVSTEKFIICLDFLCQIICKANCNKIILYLKNNCCSLCITIFATKCNDKMHILSRNDLPKSHISAYLLH